LRIARVHPRAKSGGRCEIAFVVQRRQRNRLDVGRHPDAMQPHMRRGFPGMAVDHPDFPQNRRRSTRAKPLACRDVVSRTRSLKPHSPHQYPNKSSPPYGIISFSRRPVTPKARHKKFLWCGSYATASRMPRMKIPRQSAASTAKIASAQATDGSPILPSIRARLALTA
jgi:hypothetical protein